MGILDDAIREHLELKRQHGAGSDDLDRLENEAFGPPTRPGDPDFVDQESGVANGGEAVPPAAGEAPPESGSPAEPSTGSTSDWLAGEEATTVAPQSGSPDPAPSAESARAAHPHLDDTADHPAPMAEPPPAPAPAPEPPAIDQPPTPEPPLPPEPPPLAEPLPPPPAAAEPQVEPTASPPEPPESSIFDADDIDFGDLDLEEEDDGTVGPQPSGDEPNPFVTEEEDLSLAFEEEVPPTAESLLPPPPPPPRDEVLRDRAVEEDTGNHPPSPVPSREDEPAEGSAAEPPPPPAEAPAGEDLLEETPDFLRDTPEGDRAWFEQDPPKDFDFDD